MLAHYRLECYFRIIVRRHHHIKHPVRFGDVFFFRFFPAHITAIVPVYTYQCLSPTPHILSFATTGTLFSAVQLTTQAPQAIHELRSIANFQRKPRLSALLIWFTSDFLSKSSHRLTSLNDFSPAVPPSVVFIFSSSLPALGFFLNSSRLASLIIGLPIIVWCVWVAAITWCLSATPVTCAPDTLYWHALLTH